MTNEQLGAAIKSRRGAAGGDVPSNGSAAAHANGRPRTWGPLPDLERHLPSDWWRTLFNSLYLKTDGDVVENEANTRGDIDLVLQAAGLEPGDRILDLCCGQGRHSLELARRGFRNVTGVDRSRYLLRLARRRAKNLGQSVEFHEGDARKFRPRGNNRFHAVVVLGNSFGYFEQKADDDQVVETIRRALVSHGIVVLDLADGPWLRRNYQPRSWEWIDSNHFVCRERAVATDGERLITREVIVHAEKGVIADQFYAERLYSFETAKALLERHGFTDVRQHATVETASDRGQDLGMMAHRLFITGRSPRVATPSPAAKVKRRFPNVTVVMGDPSRPDAIKVNGQFNAEDFETINRMKAALAQLEGFTFKYLDNHDALIAQVRTERPEFVLNLCDEGWRNDPLRELHVPALFEMHDVPYTGAGPASLGLCYDKGLVRAIAQSLDIPTPLETYFGPDDSTATLPATLPALVKPATGDSSMGITKNAVVHSPDELIAYLNWLRTTFGRRGILVQEYLTGTEYTVGVVGNPGLTYQVLPVLEVDYSGLDPKLPKILGYESKWLPDSPYWTQVQYREAQIDDEQRRKLHDYANTLFERLGCRDYARFDFRADAEGTIKLLEVNPNPGWCWDGKLNLMAGMVGMRYADLLEAIIEAGQERVSIARELAATPTV